MIKNKLLPILNLISFIIMIVINALGMFNLFGYSTSELSNSIPTLLMPIGIVFSIVWTLIYVLLAIVCIYQLFAKYNVDNDLGVYFLLSNLLNALWVISFHSKLFFVSFVIMVILDITLFVLMNNIKFANKLIKTTFSIYLAWINVATFVSMFSFISSVDSSVYDSIALRVATGISIIILMVMAFIRISNLPYVLTIVFSLNAILLKHIIDFEYKYPEIAIVSIISIIMIVVCVIINIPNKKPKALIKGSIN